MKLSQEESNKKRKKIYENSPILFQHVGDEDGGRRLPIFYGLECGDGWLDIIDEASKKIESYSNKKISEDSTFKGFVAHQVKEKFGGLRFYVSKHDAVIDEIIIEAEKACAKTCETCGNPGTVRRGGWLKNRCDDCENERATKQDY